MNESYTWMRPELVRVENKGGAVMTEQTFQTKLAELETQIDSLPAEQQAHLKAMLEETRCRHQEIRQSIAAATDALDDWRIAMKYRIFDAEARLREARR
jgi:phosphoglycerate-specific signal transduction histidine kinase